MAWGWQWQWNLEMSTNFTLHWSPSEGWDKRVRAPHVLDELQHILETLPDGARLAQVPDQARHVVAGRVQERIQLSTLGASSLHCAQHVLHLHQSRYSLVHSAILQTISP